MKKLIVFLIAISFCLSAEAGVRATQKVLTISGTAISGTAVGSGVTVTSDSLYQTGNVGYSSMLLLVSGQVDISYQVSRDGSNWYTPYTTDGSSLTAVGGIASNVTADRWIVLPTRLAPYVRYIFAADSSSTISSNVIWQLAE